MAVTLEKVSSNIYIQEMTSYINTIHVHTRG